MTFRSTGLEGSGDEYRAARRPDDQGRDQAGDVRPRGRRRRQGPVGQHQGRLHGDRRRSTARTSASSGTPPLGDRRRADRRQGHDRARHRSRARGKLTTDERQAPQPRRPVGARRPGQRRVLRRRARVPGRRGRPVRAGRVPARPAGRTTTTTSGCSPSATGRRRRRTSPGLYHLAWQVDTIDDLAAAAATLRERGALVGATDHGVSKSLYAKDPDGIEFEVMWQVRRGAVGRYGEHAGMEPLDLAGRAGALGRRRHRLTGVRDGAARIERSADGSAVEHGAQRLLERRVGVDEPVGLEHGGSTRWLSNSRASARSRPSTQPAARTAGTGRTVGRCSTSPSVSASSAFVTGSGAVRLTGPERRWPSRWTIAPTSSSRLIQLIHCRPDPKRPPSPNLNSGSIFAQRAALRRSTIPVRRCTTRRPAASAGAVLASHARDDVGEEPGARRRVSSSSSSPRSP